MVDEKTVKEKAVTAEKKEKAVVKKAVAKKPSVKTATKTTSKKKSVEKTEITKKATTKPESKSEKYQPNYRQFYDSKIIPSLMKKFKYSSAWNLPVIKGGEYFGFISKSKLLTVYRRKLVEVTQ